jgi:Zn-dependent protease with chaperone function
MNSKHCKIFIFMIYSSLSSAFFLLVLIVFGIPIGPVVSIVMMAAWVLFCVWSGPYFTEYSIFRHGKIRKPILEEEYKMHPLMQEVQQRSQFPRPLRLLIIEEDAIDAYSIGMRTIVISKTMIQLFLPDELRGMVAHEMGHLKSWDRVIGMAYQTVVGFSERIHRLCQRFAFLFLLFGIILFLVTYLKSGKYNFWPLAIIPGYLLVYPKFHRLILFCWRAINRHRKYQHDEFAFSLGYGLDLLNFLFRLTRNAEMPVNTYHTITQSNYPIIYNRIRHLEKLLGLR